MLESSSSGSLSIPCCSRSSSQSPSNSELPDNSCTMSKCKLVTDANTVHSLLTARLLLDLLLSSRDESLVLRSLSLSLCFFFLWYFFWWSPWCLDEPEINITFLWLSMKDSSSIKNYEFTCNVLLYNMTCNKDKHTAKMFRKYTNYSKTLSLSPGAWFTSHTMLQGPCPTCSHLHDLKFSHRCWWRFTPSVIRHFDW